MAGMRRSALVQFPGSKPMQQQSTSSQKPVTVRGSDGRAHLVSDMKRQDARPPLRIRPIVPNIFRIPD
jgi:hypothetical protein